MPLVHFMHIGTQGRLLGRVPAAAVWFLSVFECAAVLDGYALPWDELGDGFCGLAPGLDDAHLWVWIHLCVCEFVSVYMCVL